MTEVKISSDLIEGTVELQGRLKRTLEVQTDENRKKLEQHVAERLKRTLRDIMKFEFATPEGVAMILNDIDSDEAILVEGLAAYARA